MLLGVRSIIYNMSFVRNVTLRVPCGAARPGPGQSVCCNVYLLCYTRVLFAFCIIDRLFIIALASFMVNY